MYIIDRKTTSQNSTRMGRPDPSGRSHVPDLLFSIDINYINGNVVLETRVMMVAGDVRKELSFEGQDRIEYLPEFGKPVDYEPIALEIKEFVEKCISDARGVCLFEGCYYPAGFEFPEVDMIDLCQALKKVL